MKLSSLLVVVLVGMGLFLPLAAFAESENPVVIKSISHSKDSEVHETITFKFTASVVPKLFTLRGENPRLVIDFPESIYWGKNVITLTDAHLASAIRIGLHETPVKRTRAVIDLSKAVAVQHASEYTEQENTLVVTLTTDPLQPQSSLPAKPQPQSQTVLPNQVELTAQPQDEKPLVPVAPIKEAITEATVAPTGGTIAAPVVPTIIEISFDDSSSRGEMVLIRLNNFYPPIVSTIEKETPRVLCDFAAMDLASDVQMNIEAKGKFIERIRTAKHHDPENVRVVLDLSPDRDYDLQQVFFRNDNLFVLIVNELAPAQNKE